LRKYFSKLLVVLKGRIKRYFMCYIRSDWFERSKHRHICSDTVTFREICEFTWGILVERLLTCLMLGFPLSYFKSWFWIIRLILSSFNYRFPRELSIISYRRVNLIGRPSSLVNSSKVTIVKSFSVTRL